MGQVESNPDPNHPVLALQQTAPRGDAAEQIVRFARPNIPFYDEHVIDLYDRICALYRMGKEKIQKQRKSRTAIQPCDVRLKKRRTGSVLFSTDIWRSYWKPRIFPWWAHQGSNLGPAD